MKKLFILATALMTMFVFAGCTGSSAQQDESGARTTPPGDNSAAKPASTKDHKILVAYFSHSGNTRNIATQIHDAVGGDIFEIKTVKQYNTDFETTVAEAKEEQRTNARPALTAKIDNMQDYDVVFLGFPNWCGTMPMALFTFLEQYDFKGKTIVPFCTHGTSGLSNTINDLKKLALQSDIREVLDIPRKDVRTADEMVKTWLRKLGYAQ